MKLHPRLSAEAVVLARRAERLRPVAERDGRGWVVGYGHRASAREGARVGEGDATVLLVYDLSRSAAQVADLAPPETPQPLFDALNAYAFRVGPDAFARSAVLRRVKAGEPLTPDEMLRAREEVGPGEPLVPSAVLAAAAAVSDRLAQVLDAPEPATPPRARREPWPEPAEAPAPPAPVPPSAPVAAEPLQKAAARAPDSDRPFPSTAVTPHEEEAPPPPLIDSLAAPPDVASEASPPSPPAAQPTSDVEPPMVPVAPAFPAPVVSFERGGRPRLWDRLRGDPRVYMAVGACGLVLFACALLGSVLARPTATGVAMGLVGVLCLAPAIAFFLHRRGEGG